MYCRGTFLILMLNIFCVFSKIPHEVVYLIGCAENNTTEVQYEFDDEEILYMDFKKNEIVYSVPPSLLQNPSEIVSGIHILKDALKGKIACVAALAFLKIEEKNPPEEKDIPVSMLYPANEVELGVANNLTCFVNHFYPPEIKVSWTKNGHQVSEGVLLSRYYPNKDLTFHQFSYLKFTPAEGDIYSCTVEHLALDQPQTRIWEVDISHPSIWPTVFCGVAMSLGSLGVAGGLILMVKGHLGPN
ncbi:H-2 class II histocompatibility antigen, A-U alpha chain-like [Cheilinus undulatus]|uniref:H-2 class II histocompatibility antigen, A-U alpha chain-like n=1 Tax=Cheilinus undulatus TaxID=241271 RepID=UPI001BD4E3AD|nr:H-2 class II histocompatibility antigen, A-U alpha chain-like [Cheilinus undulatus]